MSILAEKLPAFRRRLLDALLPQDCLLCIAPAGNRLLCADCSRELPRLPAAGCPRCAQPGAPGIACGRCQKRPPHFDAMLALHPYAFPVDRLIQRLKYAHQLAIAEHFGSMLAEACQQAGADLIVPMPLHPARLRERGFNQAMEISRSLARATGLPVNHRCCTRNRPTVPQEGLGPAARRRNLRNAFSCSIDFGGRHLLLVDDVATTGASANECARTMKLHGAGRVTVAVVARTLLD